MQEGGELIAYWPRAPEDGRENEWDPSRRADRELGGEDRPPAGPGPNGMLSAQAHDFPAAGPRHPRTGSRTLRGGKTEVTIQNSFLIPRSRTMEQTVGNSRLRKYDFRGSPNAGVAASKSAHQANLPNAPAQHFPPRRFYLLMRSVKRSAPGLRLGACVRGLGYFLDGGQRRAVAEIKPGNNPSRKSRVKR